MQSSSRFLITAGISVGFLSMIYFLSLVCHVPFWLTLPLIATAVFFIFWWILKRWDGGPYGDTDHSKWALFILLAGIALIIQKSYPLAEKYGGWDAWSIWNVHARYLAAGAEKWQQLLLNTIGHPDYPLLVPGVNGFFIRLFHGAGSATIPFVFAFCLMLFIPVLLYLENVKKNIVVAGIVLFLFAQDGFYLRWGVSQYADTALAFFFLCALICIERANESKRNIAIAAASLGCCIWTKNEGVILALVFIVFNLKTFLKSSSILYFVGGIAVPLLVFVVFKVWYAPPNDLLAGQSKETFDHLFMPAAYELIYRYFMLNMNANFYYVKIGFYAYVLLCLVAKRWPDRQLFMLVGCMAAYTMVYVFSPQVLEWHLQTSQDRLLHQLMPAMLFVLSKRFSDLQITLRKQEAL